MCYLYINSYVEGKLVMQLRDGALVKVNEFVHYALSGRTLRDRSSS